MLVSIGRKDWRGNDQKLELAVVLQPEPWLDGGSLEQARQVADEACKVIGQLLAIMVEKRLLTLVEAKAISGTRLDIEGV